jgi:hypothetical protein
VSFEAITWKFVYFSEVRYRVRGSKTFNMPTFSVKYLEENAPLDQWVTYEIEVPSTRKVVSLKRALSRMPAVNIPVEEQRIACRGRVLQDEKMVLYRRDGIPTRGRFMQHWPRWLEDRVHRLFSNVDTQTSDKCKKSSGEKTESIQTRRRWWIS